MPDFSNVLIYWEAKGTEEDAESEKILERKAGYLRYLLQFSAFSNDLVNSHDVFCKRMLGPQAINFL